MVTHKARERLRRVHSLLALVFRGRGRRRWGRDADGGSCGCGPRLSSLLLRPGRLLRTSLRLLPLPAAAARLPFRLAIGGVEVKGEGRAQLGACLGLTVLYELTPICGQQRTGGSR